MRRSTETGFALLVLAAAIPTGFPQNAHANSAPIVTNVVAAQMAGTGNVRITFDVSDADGDQVAARVICSSDNGVTFDLLPVSVSGDANRPMSPGAGKEIIWDAARDYPGRYWAQVVARVVVSDGPVASGEMVFVPGGAFYMGSTSGPSDEQPQHAVYVDPFYIDKYEVTNAELQAFIDAGGYTTQAFWSADGWAWRVSNTVTEPLYWGDESYHSGPGYPGFPVIGVSWFEAEAYANFVGKRLPTEAEWEKAARAPDTRTYPWGDQPLSPDRANYDNSGDPFGRSTPVGFYNGQLFPNPPFQTTDSPGPLGTYDQAGNVWELVRDWYDGNYYSTSPTNNPTGPQNGTYKVVRGGSWNNDSPQLLDYLRVANRGYATVGVYRWARLYHVGFRCARSGP